MQFLQAPKPSPGPHKQRECLPLILILRNRLKYVEVPLGCLPVVSGRDSLGLVSVIGHTHERAILCRYALNGREVVAILMQRLVQVDGKVRTDQTYPTGFMDVVDIEKTDEHFRLVYDAKGRFVCHRISKVGQP